MSAKEHFSPGEQRKLAELPELQGIRIFADAATVTLTRLAMACHRQVFQEGQLILSRGDDDGTVMLLLQGTVKVTIYSPEGREVGIRRIAQGEIFGDYAAIDHQPRSADVVAVTDVQVATLSAREFVHLITADPAVANAQMRELVAMVRHLSDRVYRMTAHKASERLVASLLSMAEPNGPNAGRIDDMPTHAELAALISSQRHVVTTELRKLEEQGLVLKLSRSVLEIPDLAALRRLEGEI